MSHYGSAYALLHYKELNDYTYIKYTIITLIIIMVVIRIIRFIRWIHGKFKGNRPSGHLLSSRYIANENNVFVSGEDVMVTDPSALIIMAGKNNADAVISSLRRDLGLSRVFVTTAVLKELERYDASQKSKVIDDSAVKQQPAVLAEVQRLVKTEEITVVHDTVNGYYAAPTIIALALELQKLDNHVTVLAGDGRLLLDIMNADGCRHNRIRMIKTLYYCADGEIKPVDRNTLTGTVPR